MKLKFLVLAGLISFSQSSYAKWLCHETASIKEQDTILTCGVGEADLESVAREKAFHNAKKEFDLLCGNDINCSGFKTEVNPLRNSCEKRDGQYKCYRGLEFRITKVRGSSADLQKLDKELERKQKEYELAREKYEKKKQIEELNRKIEDNDFNKTEGQRDYSVPQNLIMLGVLADFSSFTFLGDYSGNYFNVGFVAKYSAFKQVMFQLKTSNISGTETDLSDESNFSIYDTPLSYETDGRLTTLSVQYYFSEFRERPDFNWFVGFGIGRFNYDYIYEYEDESFDVLTQSGSIETGVTQISFGGTTAGAFNDDRELGYEFGFEYNSMGESETYGIEYISSIYAALLWGF